MLKTLIVVGALAFTAQANAEGNQSLQGVHYKNLKEIVGKWKNNRKGPRSQRAGKAAIDFCLAKAPNTKMNAFYFESQKLPGKKEKRLVVTDVFCSEKKESSKSAYRAVIMRDRLERGARLRKDAKDIMAKYKGIRIDGFQVIDSRYDGSLENAAESARGLDSVKD